MSWPKSRYHLSVASKLVVQPVCNEVLTEGHRAGFFSSPVPCLFCSDDCEQPPACPDEVLSASDGLLLYSFEHAKNCLALYPAHVAGIGADVPGLLEAELGQRDQAPRNGMPSVGCNTSPQQA